MARATPNVSPRHFFLNEHHEMRGEKDGGGRTPEYVDVNWRSKGARIYQSLLTVGNQLSTYRDPIKRSRYFLLAVPETKVAKKSQDKKRAIDGKVLEDISYREAEARIFARLGLDLIHVNSDGSAMVHARADHFEQLKQSSQNLEEFGLREKARWATINSFAPNKPEFVYDEQWLQQLSRTSLVTAVVELQPLLTLVEAEDVARAVAELFRRPAGEGFRTVGTDFSGRRWLTGKVFPDSLRKIATSFYSIQSIHPPLESIFVGSTPTRTIKGHHKPILVDSRTLPCVGVLDTGVPADHKYLAGYRRGSYVSPAGPGAPMGDHGSLVASRIVFGDVDFSAGVPDNIQGECAFYDVNVAIDHQKLDEKNILPALEAIVSVAPDVRVFNLSFDNVRPLDAEWPIARREKLNLVQDLDNFAFARDVVIIVAAGNSPPGIIPSTPYPRHFTDPQWALGTWPRSFNSLTCGSFVGWPGNGVATDVGSPSPFTKAGWGLCDSPKPDLSENGGNGNESYRFQPGLGVWGTSAAGNWEDHSGTSFAAPLLARQAAFAFQRLESYCEPSTRVFGATVKAYLVLSAIEPDVSAALRPLAERTLGRGRASADWLLSPRPDRAMIVWQGVLEGPKDLIRVKVPVPQKWLDAAKAPHLRIILAWDSPANAAVESLWASRKVTATFRAQLGSHALHPSGATHKTYPISERKYDLKKLPAGVAPPQDELWLLELAYQPAAEYHSAIDFNPQQRVAFAAELYDDGEAPSSPQAALQSLPATASMTRFTVGATVVRNPVILRNRH